MTVTYVEVEHIAGEPFPVEALSPVSDQHDSLQTVKSLQMSVLVRTTGRGYADYIIINAPVVLDSQARGVRIT